MEAGSALAAVLIFIGVVVYGWFALNIALAWGCAMAWLLFDEARPKRLTWNLLIAGVVFFPAAILLWAIWLMTKLWSALDVPVKAVTSTEPGAALRV